MLRITVGDCGGGEFKGKIANSSGWCGKEFNWNELDKSLSLADDRAIFFNIKVRQFFQ